MKLVRNICAAMLIVIGIISSASAQSEFTVTYNYGKLTSSEMESFVDSDSWRGWQFNYQYYLNSNMSVGILSGYQGFYEKRDRATFELPMIADNTSINAVTWRYLISVPILATTKYYFSDTGFSPYVGLGVGAYYSKQEVQFGDILVSDKFYDFGASLEFGLKYPFANNTSGILNAKYNYVNYESKDLQTSGASYFNIGAGIAFEF